MNLRHVHPGGFFWSVERVERDDALRRIATVVGRMVVFSPNAQSAERRAERLRLAGVPVLVATDTQGGDAIGQYLTDGTSSLVTTGEHLRGHDPIPAPVAVHTRVAPSLRIYARRLELAEAPVHISLIVPEDETLADDLISLLGEVTPIEADPADPLAAILERCAEDESARIASRRRFPLTR